MAAWHFATGRKDRIDLSSWLGCEKKRRAFGYISDIIANTSGNSPTPYRFDAISKVRYCAGVRLNRLSMMTGDGATRWLFWARATSYISNVPFPPNTAIRLGPFPHGVVAARYNGAARANLEVWLPADWGDWHTTAGDTLIARSEVGLSSGPPPSPSTHSIKYLFAFSSTR